ncbi:MAG: GTPase [Algisphaera sp.]
MSIDVLKDELKEGGCFTLLTARQPGAVAVLQVVADADDLCEILTAFCGACDWPVGRLRLVSFAGIDTGLAGRVSATVAQLMPHGGPRVVQRMEAWLVEHGVVRGGLCDGRYDGLCDGLSDEDSDAAVLYPEAASPMEADVLHAVAMASSPAAVDRLAAQPRLWREACLEKSVVGGLDSSLDVKTKSPLDHLLYLPSVVVVGRPNAGKSTLLNRLMGRAASLVSDVPGTTRDWVGGRVELMPVGGDPRCDGVLVNWLDTPGLRLAGANAVERQAIELAAHGVAQADVLVELGAPDVPWPDATDLPRPADLRVMNKADAELEATCADVAVGQGEVLRISAREDLGIDALAAAVLKCLGLGAAAPPRNALWAFSPTLRRWVAGELSEDLMRAYLGQ